VLVEYQLPLTSKRADVVLCGVHPRTGQSSYVVVELKQWRAPPRCWRTRSTCEGCQRTAGPGCTPVSRCGGTAATWGTPLRTLADLATRRRVWCTCTTPSTSTSRSCSGCPRTSRGRLFTGQRRAEFLDYLCGRLAPASGAEAADQLLGCAVRPSRQLLALAADEVQRREMSRLQDQQQTAYRLVLRALERARRGDTKQAIVVVGGPGRARASSRCRCSASCHGRAGRCCRRPARRRSPRRCASWRGSGRHG
jgi:hypothetical protein